MREIYFWQNIVSPHMAGLAASLARAGCRVSYIATRRMSERRALLGWQAPENVEFNVRIAPSRREIIRLADRASDAAIHISEGLRGNGLIASAQATLRRRRLRNWIAMETINPAGWRGWLRGLEYRRLLRSRRDEYEGLFAIGHVTPEWVKRRGARTEKVFPFAYFLPTPVVSEEGRVREKLPFRFLFVGQFVPRKRVDLLIGALRTLKSDAFELRIVGSGPLEEALKVEAEAALPGRVRWIGKLPANRVADEMAEADCLVLPSRHDGWGAVVSEAMMVGTPVVCSDACGAALAVRQSRHGGVFENGSVSQLAAHLERQLSGGAVDSSARKALAAWADCLSANVGARYLMAILDHVDGRGPRPVPPWQSGAG